jgi:hypothetical protein
LNLDNLTIASPDMGGSKRAYAYSKALKSDVVICYKQRAKANIISHMELIGDVQGKNVILVDDMIDTGGTLAHAANLMNERGALSVRAICTHPILSGDAYDKIEKSSLSILLPSGIIWKNAFHRSSGSVVFNERSNELKWELNSIDPQVGYQYPAEELIFQIGIKPQSNQGDDDLNFINSIKFEGFENSSELIHNLVQDISNLIHLVQFQELYLNMILLLYNFQFSLHQFLYL